MTTLRPRSVMLALGLALTTCPRDRYEAWIAPGSTADALTVVFGDSKRRERPVYWEGLVVFRFDARDERVWSLTDTSNGGQGTRQSRITLGHAVPGAAAELAPEALRLAPGCYWLAGYWQDNDLRFRVDSTGQVQTLPREYDQRAETQQPHRLMSCLIMTSPYRKSRR
jgi:hypothetical protein